MRIVVILSDQYEDNFISHGLTVRFSQHPWSFYYYKDDHFIIQFEHDGDYIDGAECYLYEPISKGHQVILGNKWLDDRTATFDKTTNILQICDLGVYYCFQVRLVGVVSLDKKSLDKKEV